VSVYTQLTQNQLEALLLLYLLGKLESFQEISEGIESSNYRLRIQNPAIQTPADFVLTIFENRSVQEAEEIFSFMHFINGKYFQVPAPVNNKQDVAISSFKHEGKSKFFIICPLLKGKHPTPVTVEHCQAVGERLAHLHLLTVDFEKTLPKNYQRADSRMFKKAQFDFLIPAFDFSRILDSEDQEIFNSELQRFEGVKKRLQIKSLPQGFCHCDLFPDNALFVDNHLTAVLDWYDMRHSFFALDLAIVANSWCAGADGALASEKLEALLTAYQKLRPLTAEEKQLWPDLLCLSACYFWLGRAGYQYEMRTKGLAERINLKKDPLEFLRILKKHRRSL
jgi:homoserine kinase type II